jgi:hypothetical protein
MYCTNCHCTNHNVETCKSKKKEESIVVATKAIVQASKPPRPLNYPCHIYGIAGHKLMNCSRFGKICRTCSKTEEIKL